VYTGGVSGLGGEEVGEGCGGVELEFAALGYPTGTSDFLYLDLDWA
jgi:hypothetical protein